MVLLGAGASRAAFPDGEGTGSKLPLMQDFVDIVGLRPFLEQAGLGEMCNGNFEKIYSELALQSEKKNVLKELEQRIERYFSDMSLPDKATIYDRLLVSLRPKDAVFTFNWDPFLFDAHQRNRGKVSLPEIFFLHGNVRINVPLLYPVREKNYTSNPHIKRSWDEAKRLFKDSFTFTVFGYSAPDSDKDAMELLKRAWLEESEREFEHIEIIDTAPNPALEDKWKDFIPTGHGQLRKTFEESRIARWPRRSCESLFFPSVEGKPCAGISFPEGDNLACIRKRAQEIEQYEKNITNDA